MKVFGKEVPSIGQIFNLSSGSFFKNTEVAASSSTTKVNPIVKSLDSLNGNYKVEKTMVGDYVKFGTHDDIPSILEKLKYQSPTHSGIVNKKSKMVAGNDFVYDESTVSRGNKTKFDVFFKNAAGLGKSLQKVFGDAAYSWEHYGAVPIYVKYDKALKKMVQVKVMDANSIRCGIPDMNGDIPYFIVRRSFDRHTRHLENNKPRRLPAWNPKQPKRESILYYKNPRSGNPIYGIPDYLSAYYFITADFEFGQTINNSAENGFSPKVLATFVGRNMTDEQKEEEYNKFKENFTGSKGEQVILSWVRKKEDAPDYTVLDVKNLDKTVDVMARLNDSKILTAHSVTSPTIFGIQTAGKLAGTGEELTSAYYMFRATETLPNRAIHLDTFEYLMSYGGYGSVEFEVIDVDIDPDNESPVMEDEQEDKKI